MSISEKGLVAAQDAMFKYVYEEMSMTNYSAFFHTKNMALAIIEAYEAAKEEGDQQSLACTAQFEKAIHSMSAPGMAAVEVKERLREIIKATNGSWDGEALTLWDSFRELCDEYKGASLPRDVFENWLDNINDLAIEALAEMEGTPKRESGDQLLKNLSMLVIRLSHRLSLREDGKAMAAQAMDFLQRNGLQGSPLRTDIEDDKTNKNATSAEHYKRESVECVKALSAIEDLIAEYLHWRKVNPQIKGGENYLKRLREALVYSQPAAPNKEVK